MRNTTAERPRPGRRSAGRPSSSGGCATAAPATWRKGRSRWPNSRARSSGRAGSPRPSGPGAGRRGFDSLVQAGYGIAAVCAGPDGAPGALPAQALDHGTGYLVAAGVLRALAEGGGRGLRFSLAGTGAWLVRGLSRAGAGGGAGAGASGYAAEPWLRETGSGYGLLRHAASAFGEWGAGPSRWGTDRAVWLPR
ncbi:CoA transferase [Streptomyces sp. NBC_01439]|uniref:CoA transferase n=1 Tax=Streptomyces sp. NBC_01439 TaxID=2903867 RepID=UPI003FCE9968